MQAAAGLDARIGPPVLPRRAWPLAAFGLFGLAGCLGTAVEKTIPFSLDDHRAYLAKGDAAIDGEGFIRRPNGFLARCSGGQVQLVPASPYFREWVQQLRAGNSISGRNESAAEHRAAVRTTQCDANGRFAFENLPAGKWFVSTRIDYASDRDSFSADGLFLTEVETRRGEVVKVILSNPNQIR